MTVNTDCIMKAMDMRMGEADVFPCVSLSLSNFVKSAIVIGSHPARKREPSRKLFLDIAETFTFLMQEKHCPSFAFDYTMLIKQASGSLITPAVWSHGPSHRLCL